MNLDGIALAHQASAGQQQTIRNQEPIEVTGAVMSGNVTVL